LLLRISLRIEKEEPHLTVWPSIQRLPVPLCVSGRARSDSPGSNSVVVAVRV